MASLLNSMENRRNVLTRTCYTVQVSIICGLSLPAGVRSISTYIKYLRSVPFYPSTSRFNFGNQLWVRRRIGASHLAVAAKVAGRVSLGACISRRLHGTRKGWRVWCKVPRDRERTHMRPNHGMYNNKSRRSCLGHARSSCSLKYTLFVRSSRVPRVPRLITINYLIVTLQ